MAHLKGKVISNDGNTALVKYSNGEELSIPRQGLMNQETFLRLLAINCTVGQNFQTKERKKKN
jgi:hypothetical protein